MEGKDYALDETLMIPMGTLSAAVVESINRHNKSVSQDSFTCNYIGTDIENQRTCVKISNNSLYFY